MREKSNVIVEVLDLSDLLEKLEDNLRQIEGVEGVEKLTYNGPVARLSCPEGTFAINRVTSAYGPLNNIDAGYPLLLYAVFLDGEIEFNPVHKVILSLDAILGIPVLYRASLDDFIHKLGPELE